MATADRHRCGPRDRRGDRAPPPRGRLRGRAHRHRPARASSASRPRSARGRSSTTCASSSRGTALLTQLDDVHVLVNNAARTEFRPFFEIDLDEWDDVLATNLRGTYSGAGSSGAHMRERGGGRIVNLASDAAFAASGGSGVHYAASKAGVVAVTRRAATELAPHGVTVNAIAPAAIDGPLAREVLRDRLEEKLADIPVGSPRAPGGGGGARRVPRLRRRGLPHRRDAGRQRRRADAVTALRVD